MGQSALWILVQAHPLAAVAAVFLLDGIGVPLLPELAFLGAFLQNPSWGWGAALLAVATAVEVTVAAALYFLTGVLRLPRWLRRLMDGYAGSLFLNDERLILVNRIVPVLPVVGAFIRVRKWRPRLALFYVGIGSFAKYGLLMLGATWAYAYFDSSTALAVSLSLAAAFLSLSWGYSIRRMLAERRSRRELEADAA